MSFTIVDCEILEHPCSVGDEIRIKVIDTGDGYITNTKKVIIHDSMGLVPTLQLIRKKLSFL